jgi:bifunctional non-homologous end joining protein LigD
MPEVKLSNPDKVLFPDDGLTKADLAGHYARVAEAMLPHVKDRPMNLWRWNNGIQGERVVQQSLPKGAPDWVARVEVPRRKGGNIFHGLINDADTLRWLAQQNCITPHVWNSRRDKLDRPDRVVFDLDPTQDDFGVVREGALAVAEVLRDLGVTPFAMVSGSRGIHVYAPLKRTRTADEIRAAAQTIAERVVEASPDTLTTAWRKEKREEKILVDVARNTYGQTVVAPYAVRALPGAPVATPVSWDEVASDRLDPQQFKLPEFAERLRDAGDPWEEMESAAATLPRDLFTGEAPPGVPS